jgi:hypothetical protein
MADMYTSIGAKLSLSASAPATFDASGYAALTYSKIGLIGKIGDLSGKWDEDKFNILETGGTVKAKTFRDAGSTELEIGYKPADTGQALLKTAYEDALNDYSFKLEMPDGEVRYFQAKVMEYTYVGNDGNFQKLKISLSLQTDPNGNDVIIA